VKRCRRLQNVLHVRPADWLGRAWPLVCNAAVGSIPVWKFLYRTAFWLTALWFALLFGGVASRDEAFMRYARPCLDVVRAVAPLIGTDLKQAWHLLLFSLHLLLPPILQAPTALLLLSFMIYGGALLLRRL
jgi:hypothetical protein